MISEKFKEELTRRLQEYYKTNYNYDAVVQERYESKNFKINGVQSSHCFRIYFKRGKVSVNDSDGFNFPIDELRIRNASVFNGKSHDELFQVDFNYRSTCSLSYNFKGPQIDSLFDIVAKYYKPRYETLTDSDTHEEIHPDVFIDDGNPSFVYKISTSHGETLTWISAYRNPTNKSDQYFHIRFNVDYGYSKWIRYLKNNVITVTEDESTWNDAINKILDVITTINKEVANYVKEIVAGTMNQFIEKVKEVIKLQGN